MDTALSILAGDVSLQVGQEIMALCRSTLLSTCTQAEGQHATWLCRDAAFFTLFKTQHSPSTLLFSHTNGVLYHASPQAQLSPACPCNTGFLCQFTHDTLPEGAVPRLLVFDVVPMQPMEARGDFLRSMAQHLPQPLCTVQLDCFELGAVVFVPFKYNIESPCGNICVPAVVHKCYCRCLMELLQCWRSTRVCLASFKKVYCLLLGRFVA